MLSIGRHVTVDDIDRMRSRLYITTGTLVLRAYRVRHVLVAAGRPTPAMSKRTIAAVVGAVAVVAIPLTWGTTISAYQQSVVSKAQPVADQWAEQEGWQITGVTYAQGALQITALGSLPEADASLLRADLDAAGLGKVDTRVTLVIGGSKDLPATE